MEYDIGVYFEANGHGTIVFSENARETIKNISRNKEYVSIQIAISIISEGHFGYF